MTETPISDGSGALQRFNPFPSQFAAPRPVDIWLPPGYTQNTPCPVIYMHDGQNLFDPAWAFGGIDWGIDEAVTRLAAQGAIAPAIVVGVWNISTRWREYFPEKPFYSPRLTRTRPGFLRKAGGPPTSDAYLRLLVEEIKPFVDANFATLPGPEHTAVMGSSMGGLVSLYALNEYPHIFGRAGCLSTHWPAGGNVLVEEMAAGLPAPGTHRIWFDHGDATLDAGYAPFQQHMDELLNQAGWQPGRDYLTRTFPGAEHSEAAWRARVDQVLRFLLA